MALRRAAPVAYYHHAGENFSKENPSPNSHLDPEGAILKKYVFKMKFECEWVYESQIYPIKPSAAFPDLVKLSL
jgi:hypothetical protein